MDCNSRLSNSVTISLFINVCLYLCVIFSSNVAAGNKEIHFSGHPVIGRLFKADAVKSTGVGLPTNKFQSPKHELNEDIFHSSTSLGKEGRLDLGDNLNRESRSKSVILSGIKYEVDSSQDKTKKGAYEASKKPIKRNQSVRRRVKRSDNSEHGKLRTVSTAVGDVNSTGRFNASMNITNNIDESSLKKSYAKKAFKRRIEALFTERAGSPRLSEEEVNKTKNLRKQLLNIYVRGKQNKYYTHSNTTTLYRTDLNDEVIKSEKPFLRVRIDIPIESSSDWDLVQEIRNEDENNHLNEGQGRSGLRRIRKIIIPLLLALKLKTAIVVPLLFGAVSLVAFKGLWAGMTALAMVSALALKSLMHGKSSVTYEVRAPPPHYHMPHHVHDYGYHHGYLHPEYHWSRNDDSYKPQGGWRGGEATDHSATNVNSGLDTTSYSTINIDERSEPLSMNCSSSNSATVDEIRTI